MLAPLSHPDLITIFDLSAYAHLHYIAEMSVVGQQLVEDQRWVAAPRATVRRPGRRCAQKSTGESTPTQVKLVSANNAITKKNSHNTAIPPILTGPGETYASSTVWNMAFAADARHHRRGLGPIG